MLRKNNTFSISKRGLSSPRKKVCGILERFHNILSTLKCGVSSLRKNVCTCSIHPQTKVCGILERFHNKSFIVGLVALFILGLAAFMRFYKFGSMLGFWYDQGRDALVVWDTIYKGKLTLIGPQMGFTGIFRGGWYYWLITPLYFFGKGNPIFPSAFLIMSTILAIYILFVLGKKMGNLGAGLMAMFIASVSMYIVGASRWLSDPTPTLLISVLLVFSLFKYSEGKMTWLISAGFLSGMALQFSAAAEIFYIPAVFLIVLLLKKKVRPGFKNIMLSICAFLIAFIPQMLFEIRHPGVQTGAFYNFLFHEKTFTYAFWEIAKDRLTFDYQMIASKFWVNGYKIFAPFFAVFFILLVANWRKLWRSDNFKIVIILGVAPLVGTMFFVSNLGGVYEYYFTGYYLIWVLLISYVYMFSSKRVLIKILIGVFLALILFLNLKVFKDDYLSVSGKRNTVVLVDQISAINWVYKMSGDRNFNVDVYVPPVIPYAYDYLFKWIGGAKYSRVPWENQVSLLYTLYEEDLSHPERLQAWMDRQRGIGKVLKEEKFGMITVQERQRINK